MRHRYTRLALTAVLPIMLAACASGPGTPSDALASDSSSNCRVEVPTGSNVPHKVCSAPMTDPERDQAQRDLMTHGQPTRN